MTALEGARRLGHVADFRVEYHRRYAFPLTCFIVIWLGVPLGVRTSRRGGAMMGVATALVLVVAKANEHGGEDNVTVVVIHVTE